MDRIGRYRIVRELGRGAMGIVYHAIDPHIGRPVAIKTIELNTLRKPEEQERLRERLFREARSAGILSHPGIVTIYDVDQQGDLAYIAMEYVDGPTLDQLLSEQGAITPEKMFSVLSQIAVALDYAHQKGIVHRDIKPANIMLTSDGTTKITDFGIAKITASDQFTMTGSIVGTPHYMSPEQVQGKAVDGRSDQFSLAVMAFEMLTGEKPYTGENLTTVVYKIVTEEPVPPHRLNPTLGGAIEAALRKALAKKSEMRYRNCQEFAEALEKACAATPGWKTIARGGSLNAPTIAEAPRPAVTLPPPHRARRTDNTSPSKTAVDRSAMLTFFLAILAVAGLLALIGTRSLPWLAPRVEEPKTVQQQPLPEPKQSPPPQIAKQDEPKPSPMPPAPETISPVKKAPEEVEKAADSRPLIHIISSPGGATAELDGRADVSCRTPCSLEVLRGRHNIAVILPGYQVEHREVTVTSEHEIELPAIILRAAGGTVMLTSVPTGAAVLVNGRRTGQTTPAQIALSPGTYTIGVEKDGKQASQMVEVRNGLSSLKMMLEQ